MHTNATWTILNNKCHFQFTDKTTKSWNTVIDLMFSSEHMRSDKTNTQSAWVNSHHNLWAENNWAWSWFKAIKTVCRIIWALLNTAWCYPSFHTVSSSLHLLQCRLAEGFVSQLQLVSEPAQIAFGFGLDDAQLRVDVLVLICCIFLVLKPYLASQLKRIAVISVSLWQRKHTLWAAWSSSFRELISCFRYWTSDSFTLNITWNRWRGNLQNGWRRKC